MLDALKVLFILTGASTYLVTKYVKVDNKNSSLSKMRIRVKDTSIGKTHFLNIDSANNSSFDDIVDVNSIDERVKNYNNDAERDVNFDADSEIGENGNNRKNDNKNYNFIEFVRPLYVITVVEEDDRDLPKLLLQVSAPNSDVNNSNNINSNAHHSNFINNNANFNKNAISYSLNTNNGDIVALNKLFFINSTTGELFLIRPLDRDLPNGKPKWKYSINAKHVNTTNPFAFADVVINVKDINDNKPFFTESIYHTNVSENGPSGLALIQVSAIDYDDSNDSSNGRITYSIVENHFDDNDNPIFGIDSESGIISTLVCCIDREINSQFVLWISATDGQGLSGTSQVIVTVDDQNDCLPKFRTRNRTIEIDDDSSDGEEDEEIIALYVSDDDLIESNQFVYEIVNCSNCGVYKDFYIVTNSDGSGSLMARNVDNTLDYNKYLIYYLAISVSDINDTFDESRKDYAFITIIYNRSYDNSNNRIKTYSRDNNNNNSNKSGENQCTHCHNGGICFITTYGFGFKCQCVEGFTGVLCDQLANNQSLMQLTNSNALICGIIIGLINVFVLISSFILYTKFRSKNSAGKDKTANSLSNCDYDEEEKVEESVRTASLNSHNSSGNDTKKKMDDMKEFVKPEITYKELTTVVEMSVFDGKLTVHEQTIGKQDNDNEKQLLLQQNQSFSCGCVDSGISDGSGERPDIVVGCADHLLSNIITDAIGCNTNNARHVFISDINSQMDGSVSDGNDDCAYDFGDISETSSVILRY